MRRYLKIIFVLIAAFPLLSSAAAQSNDEQVKKAVMDDNWRACFDGQDITLGENIKLPKAQSIYPDVLPHQEDSPYLRVKLMSQVYKFETGKGSAATSKRLAACYWMGEGDPKPINIRSIEHVARGTAIIDLDLPTEDFYWSKGGLRYNIDLLVVSEDKDYIARGSFDFVPKGWAFVAATLLTVGIVYGIFSLRRFQARGIRGESAKTSRMGLFIGEGGQPSLSLFQIFLWTVLTVWSLLYVYFNTGNLLALTNQVMILLGFAGVGSLSARWIAAGRQLGALGPVKEEAPRFWAMLEADGKIDLFKVQLLLFTVLIAGYVAFRIVRQSAFPELDPQFLLLMGVSNGLYVGTKFTQSSPLAVAGARKIEIDALYVRQRALEEREEKLTADLQKIESQLDDPAIDHQPPETKLEIEGKKTVFEQAISACKTELAEVMKAIETKTSQYKKALESASLT